MRTKSWNYPPYESAPERQEVDIPISYTIPFEWGALYVSETANETYGLTPFTATEPGFVLNPERETATSPQARIFLITPGELESPSSSYPSPASVRTLLNKQGIEMSIAVGFNKEQQRAQTIKQIESVTGMDPDEIVENLRFENGDNELPFEEGLELNIPQMMIHGLSGLIAADMSAATKAWTRAEYNRESYKRLRQLGVASVLAAGGVGLLLGYIARREPFELGLGAGFTGGYTAMFTQSLRTHFRSSSQTQRDNDIYSINYGQTIGEDIHVAYCRAHFDSTLESSLNPEEDN